MNQISSSKKIVFILLGSLCFILGALGLFVPLLPTTPFWLLTAYFYTNSSKTLYDKVMHIPLFGKTISNFRLYRAIPLHAKIISISLLWITSSISAVFIDRVWITILLVLISTGVTIHILSYKTLPRKLIESKKKGK